MNSSVVQIRSSFEARLQIQKRAEIRREVERRVRRIQTENLKTLSDKLNNNQIKATIIKKTSPVAKQLFRSPVLPPPIIHGKVLLTSILLEKIHEPRHRRLDIGHLKKVYRDLGLEIVISSDQYLVYFFVTEQIAFDALGDNKHPLCRSKEKLVGKPSDTLVHVFNRSNERVVRYGETNLLFVKES